jgi:hypothetical protein
MTIKKEQKIKMGTNYLQFYQDLRMCFRAKDDRAYTRKNATTSADEISSNLDLLIDKWTTLDSTTIDAIGRLQVEHMVCLSDLPVGGGSHRNEGIHKQLNGFCPEATSLSIELAIAMLTVFFIKHNRKIDKNPLPLVSMSTQSMDMIIEAGCLIGFGLVPTTKVVIFPEVSSEKEPRMDTYENIAKNIKNLVDVQDSLNHLQNSPFEALNVLLCCPLKKLESAANECDSFINDLLRDFNVVLTGNTSKHFEESVISQFLFETNSEDLKMEIFENQSIQSSDDLYTWLTEKLQQKTPQKVANFLKSVIIVLIDNIKHPIQTITPVCIRNKKALIVCMKNEEFFCTKQKSAAETVASPVTKCTCGKGKNDGTKYCVTSSCPCFLNGCSKQCKCLQCGNPNGTRKKRPINGCRCGGGALAGTPTLTCGPTTKCPCSTSGYGCIAK